MDIIYCVIRFNDNTISLCILIVILISTWHILSPSVITHTFVNSINALLFTKFKSKRDTSKYVGGFANFVYILYICFRFFLKEFFVSLRRFNIYSIKLNNSHSSLSVTYSCVSCVFMHNLSFTCAKSRQTIMFTWITVNLLPQDG